MNACRQTNGRLGGNGELQVQADERAVEAEHPSYAMPQVLDCGHGVVRNVIVGYHPDPEGVRRRTYECRTCGHISYGEA